MGSLDEYTAALTKLPPAQRQRVVEEARAATATRLWIPNPGPQFDAYFNEADELLFGGEAGGGKLLALGTPIPTPSGWTTMGDVLAGDHVLDEAGKPCMVEAKSDIESEDTYRLTFSDGAQIVAGARHQWVTSTMAERSRALKCTDAWRAERRSTRASRGTGAKPWLAARNSATAESRNLPLNGIRSTGEIAASMRTAGGRINHAIAVAHPLNLEHQDLLVDPYTLGAWLGDGTSASGSMTGADEEIFQQVANSYPVRRQASKYGYGVLGLKADLRKVGVLGNKHIPVTYLRSSHEQRLALLQGLMDTDGYCDQRGQCELSLTNRRLIDDAQELLLTLGIKCSITEGDATIGRRVIGRKYRLKFLTELCAFRLPRKLLRQKRVDFRGTHQQRYIVSAERIAPVPMQCIQVNSPSRTYLCGRQMIPTHNSDLIIGLSLTEHRRSLVLRRTNKEAEKLFDRFEEIIGNRDGMNAQKGWRIGGRIIDIGGCQLEADKQKRKGIPHDLKAFDELVDFEESQYVFIIAWNRSTDPTQRTRIVCTTNPPTRPEGMWVVRRWAPWLDPNHHRPAKDGELRWYTTIDGQDTEVGGPGPHTVEGKQVIAKSRTFIRSKLADNPDLTQTPDYQARLNALPKELREAFAEGKFEAGLKDAPFQAIPTHWIREAMDRWTEKRPVGVPMCAIGVDMSGGSSDPMIIAPRYDGWYDKLIEVPAHTIPAERPGKFAAGLVVGYRRDSAIVVVDMGGGHGGGIYEQLKDNSIEVVGHKGMDANPQRTAEGQLGFFNTRTKVIWRFREALDPSQPGGSPISLHPDQMLLADLAAPTFTMMAGKLKVESKEDVVDRLKRSTDRGDAVVMAWSAGPTYITDGDAWRALATERAQARGLGRRPQVIMGRQGRR